MFKSFEKHTILLTFVFTCFIGLILKAAQLQIFSKKYAAIAQRTTLNKQTIYPSRGLIFDRNEKLLVYNKPVYDLNVVFNQVSTKMDTTLFCDLLEIEKPTFNQNIKKNWKNSRYSKATPFTFLSKIEPHIFARFQEHLHDFPGFTPSIRNIRSYPHSNAAHLLGYLGEVNNTILKDSSNYTLGDYIGKSGVERTYEKVLRGRKGHKYILKDNFGRDVASYDEGNLDENPKSGSDLIATIDLELQAYGEKLMQNKRGSIVILEPKTGEILSMVSSPNYDPNALNLGSNRGETFNQLYKDSINKPFMDRSLNAKYPPGSIFKPILALIAFQEGVSKPNDYVKCNGYYQYKTFKYKCHEHTPCTNVQIAIQHSCNSYFFDMVRDVIEVKGFDKPEIGLTILDRYLNEFGLGKKLGIDNLLEQSGFVPSPSFYNKLYNDPYSSWKSTYIMSIGIGQGELELTTVQMANLAAIIANRGFYYTPHLIKRSKNALFDLSQKFKTKNTVSIDDIHFYPVIEGMRKTVKYGTGYKAQIPGIEVCGKTGTSQNSFGKDHSVFFAFAPLDDPKIAIAVYVENAGFGGDIAAPIAGLLIEKYLKGDVSPFKKNTEELILAKNLIE